MGVAGPRPGGTPGPVGSCPPCLLGAQAWGGGSGEVAGARPREGKGGRGGESGQIGGPLGGPSPPWRDPGQAHRHLHCPPGHGERTVRLACQLSRRESSRLLRTVSETRL